MRWRSVRAQRSVDRGRAGGVIEPRNSIEVQGAIPGAYDELHAREPGDLVVAREVLVMPRPGGFAGWQADTGRAARRTLRR
jgi:hypothetical protein